MADDRFAPGLDRLADLQNRDGGWGYAPGRDSTVEPTAAACLAHVMQGAPVPPRAVDWLHQSQLTDGSWALSRASNDSSWVSAWAVWALARAGRRDQRLERGVSWLLREPVLSFDDEVGTAAVRRLLEVDPTASGWPWQPGEASWVTPTALSVIALCSCGAGAHPRVREARRYLADRACAAGGWNFGNPVMIGRTLLPLASDTGAALLSLRHLSVPADDPDVTGALTWLEKPGASSWGALDRAWACIGLGVWGRGAALRGLVERDLADYSVESSLGTLALALGLMALGPEEGLAKAT